MSTKSMYVPFNAPLSEKDTAEQTYGCRAKNPDICAHSHVPGICAFVSSDGICRHPSKAWKKQYQKLKTISNALKETHTHGRHV